MISRSKRASKKVDYAAAADPFSDDDFAEFTPPTKKKKKKSENDKENETNSQDKRSHVEERIFQRELQKALELSAQETKDDLDDFKEGEQHSQASENGTSNSPPMTSVLSVVTTAEVHATASGERLKESNVVGGSVSEDKISQSRETRTDTTSPSSKGGSLSRKRKTVKFMEDDDSEQEWSNDIQVEKNSTDSDDSNYSSPKKLKPKKKTVPTKKGGRKASADSPKSTTSPDSAQIQRPPKPPLNVSLNTAQASHVAPAREITPKGIQSPVDTTHKVKQKCTVPSPAASSGTRTGTRLVQGGFKSPTIGSSSGPLTKPQSPSVCVRSGIRVGLSRKALLKPLHPSASVN